jgi:molecular chaperone HtpG
MYEQGNISIHTENIFPIIKKALYSERDIFLRELISNSVDAISKLKMLVAAGEVPSAPEPEINITLDKEAKTIAVSDTGLGMTADEVKKYINQVAFSSAEEFIKKYSASAGEQGIIGHFGLGFYSAFMVASKVEIQTLSCREGAQAVHWQCDGSPSFTIDDGDRTAVGTTVILHLQEDATEFLEELELKRIVKKYCDFMPFPIKLKGEVINKQVALWDKSPTNTTKEEYLEFYRYLYPLQEDPLFWIHLNTDYPFVLKGILYFPQIKQDIDPNKPQIKLYSNHVFVSDNCEEVIPKFLLPLRGVIDSTDIPLNVSRSFLQGDRRVRQIQDYIARKVADHLGKMYREQPAEFIKCWTDISIFMKFGSMNNDKFYQQIKDIMIYPTTYQGEGEYRGFTTLQDYLERTKDKQRNKVFYTSNPSAQASYIDLYKSQGFEVLTFDSFIDNHFIHFLEGQYREVRFARVDAELEEQLIDKEKKTELIDPKTNQTPSDRLQSIFRKALNKPNLKIRTEALKGNGTAPPAVILLSELQRRMLEMSAVVQQKELVFPDDHTLLINLSHPLVQNLLKLEQGQIITSSSLQEDTVSLLCQHIYDLAMMAQKRLEGEEMKQFLDRSQKVLTLLTAR